MGFETIIPGVQTWRNIRRALRFELKFGELWGKNPLPDLTDEPFASAFAACLEPESVRLRLWHECKIAELTLAADGGLLFVGVSHGRSTHCALRYLGERAKGRRVILMDTWSGAGATAAPRFADYCKDVQSVRRAFAYHQPLDIVEALAPAGFSQVKGPLAFVLFDTAVAEAEIESLPLVWPLVISGGAVLLHRAYRMPEVIDRYRATMQALPGATILPLLTGSVAIFKY